MRDFLKDVEAGAATKSPEAAAQENMRPRLIKRFYKTVEVSEVENGFTALLDGKSIKTPGRNAIVLPTKAAAQLFANEWDAQTDEINPMTMPVTRIANTAIDGVATDSQAVLEDIVKFAASDLLCYRAQSPVELVELQQKHWDPLLDWVAKHCSAHFEVGEGLMHIAQPKEAIAGVSQRLSNHDTPFKLACLHTFTSLCGSALIALTLAEKFIGVEEAWNAAHVDEDFQISKWGDDEDAQKRRKKRHEEMLAAYALFEAL